MTVPDLKVAGKYEMTGKAFVVIKDSFGPFNVSFFYLFKNHFFRRDFFLLIANYYEGWKYSPEIIN